MRGRSIVRKFFGGSRRRLSLRPATGVDASPPADGTDCDHLLTRLAGDDQKAWAQFKQHEAGIDIEPRAMSVVSARLLGAADVDACAPAPPGQLRALHRLLGPLNTIGLSLGDAGRGGPDVLSVSAGGGRRSDRRSAALGVFVPTAVAGSSRSRHTGVRSGNGWRRRRLLPLPIDHRYGPCDMEKVCQALLQVLP